METIVGVSEVSFTVIIPHYIIPDLLARCVDSIPQRDDIQVIVVDDHSPDGGNYPQMIQSLRKNNVEFVYAPRHGGAGYARNLGLERALGKWLIFADADDFFSEEAWDVFDAYLDNKSDVVYFGFFDVFSDEIDKRSHHAEWLRKIFERCLSSHDYSALRCRHWIPSSKMIRRDFVEEKSIRFEEIRYSNDVLFSVKTGCWASSVDVCDRKVYYLTERKGSLSNNLDNKEGELECRAIAACHAYDIVSKTFASEKDALYVTQWHLFRLFNEDRDAFDRCFLVALDNNVPFFRTIAYMCWYSHGIKAKMRVLAHSLRLYLT